jgi:hypothetical protein
VSEVVIGGLDANQRRRRVVRQAGRPLEHFPAKRVPLRRRNATTQTNLDHDPIGLDRVMVWPSELRDRFSAGRAGPH